VKMQAERRAEDFSALELSSLINACARLRYQPEREQMQALVQVRRRRGRRRTMMMMMSMMMMMMRRRRRRRRRMIMMMIE
jgi:hypothetical protein